MWPNPLRACVVPVIGWGLQIDLGCPLQHQFGSDVISTLGHALIGGEGARRWEAEYGALCVCKPRGVKVYSPIISHDKYFNILFLDQVIEDTISASFFDWEKRDI
jgi:hypothetical protein